MCPVFRLIYFDESSDQKDDGRIGISACMSSAYQWAVFEERWRAILAAKGIDAGDFHAVKTDTVQRETNIALAHLMKEIGIASTCVTLRTSEFERYTTQDERGNYGGAYGFARYASILALNHTFDDVGDSGSYAYYVDQGGQGGDWFVQTLQKIVGHDELRAKYRMAGYGVVDRRLHLPVHAADLVAHEVVTSRHTSEPLKILGKLVLVDDWTGEHVEEVMRDFAKTREKLTSLKRDYRAKLKRKRKESSGT